MLGDVVDEERADGAAVVCRRDCAVAFLAWLLGVDVPAVSQIWALIVLPSTWMLRVANSTPGVRGVACRWLIWNRG
jgi:hypothetical protein